MTTSTGNSLPSEEQIINSGSPVPGNALKIQQEYYPPGDSPVSNPDTSATAHSQSPEAQSTHQRKRRHESSDIEPGNGKRREMSSDAEEDRERQRTLEPGGGESEEDEEEQEEEEGEEGEQEEQGEEPPLPPGPPPADSVPDDGWQAIWDDQHQAYYFYNSITGESTWTNPRVPEATGAELPDGTAASTMSMGEVPPDGYYVDPAAAAAYAAEAGGAAEETGYEPTYYQLAHGITDPSAVTAEDIANTYQATGSFNRFTGKWQANKNPEQYNDENKSKRQMEFYFDVDAAANSHDGRSLKAERQMKKLSKKELKAFREKRKEKKEQKRRAWLKD